MFEVSSEDGGVAMEENRIREDVEIRTGFVLVIHTPGQHEVPSTLKRECVSGCK